MTGTLRFQRWMPLLAALCACCGNGVRADAGLGAWLRAENAQFVRGAPPATATKASVESVELLSSTIWPGYTGKLVSGALSFDSNGLSINLRGDNGYWLVPAAAPDVAAPDLPTFRVRVGFAAALPAPNATLELRAIDANGAFGSATTRELVVVGSAPNARVDGQLVITLAWDTEADLDLHVIDPLGNEIYHGDPSSRDGFSPSRDPTSSVGVLEYDSNAGCDLDGQRRETVRYTETPPSGHYRVRVDTTALCGAAIANFTVGAVLRGSPLAAAAGVALESDAWGSHGRGSGVLALEFDVP